VTDITDNLLTIMYFAVTGTYGTVRAAGALGITGLFLSIFQASLAEQQYAIDFFGELVPGSAPRTTTFTAPPGLTSGRAVAAASEVASSIQLGATLAAVREFAEVGQPTLAKYAAQLLGAQSEQRVLNRALLALGGDASSLPPNNKAFETDLFLYTRDAIALLQTLGFINGPGTAFAYPGRAAALAAAGAAGSAVIQRSPNNASSSVAPGSSLAGERT
jgi:hypothetical protein